MHQDSPALQLRRAVFVVEQCHDSLDLRGCARGVGDSHRLKVFADEEAGGLWFAEHDPEGVAFEYPVISSKRPRALRYLLRALV